MRGLGVGVVEQMDNRPAAGLWNRVMKPSFASIMPQVVAVRCEQMGHDVILRRKLIAPTTARAPAVRIGPAIGSRSCRRAPLTESASRSPAVRW